MTQHVSHRASDRIAMTDIVKRLREAREFELRDYEPTMQLFADAADEIERLRKVEAELHRLESEIRRIMQ
jgi:hypothetical protein